MAEISTANPDSPKSVQQGDEFEVVHRPPPPLQQQEPAPTNDEGEDSPSTDVKDPPSPPTTARDPPSPSSTGKDPPSPSSTGKDPPSPSKNVKEPALPPKTDHGPSALLAPAPCNSSSSHGSSSGNGGTDEATQTLLGMQKGFQRKRKEIAISEQEIKKSRKKKKAGDPAEIRPTASFSAYYDFMKVLEPRMRRCHWDAYQGCTFEHYVIFGPPAVDRPTLELVLSHYVGDEVTFALPDAESGGKRVVNFDMDWVHQHTGFPIDGEIIYGNRDPQPRIWMKYFAKEFTRKEKESPKNMRRYVEGLLESLVESKKKKDIEDFVLLQILYQCSMMWCPSSVQGIPRLLFKYFDCIERVRSMAWGKYIYDQTKKGIKIAREGLSKPGVSYVPGCMPLIPLWYYEMTGIKKYALSNRFKPPLTNWVMIGEKSGSLRKDTIVSKAVKATIAAVQKPIAEFGPGVEKYPLRRPNMREHDSLRIRRKGIPPLPVKKHKTQSSPEKVIKDKKADGRKKTGEEKKGEKKEEKKKSSIGLIISSAIDDAFEREDEIKELPFDEQLKFWRNAAKLNQRICHALRQSKKLYCQTFMEEIRRLNEKVKGTEGSDDIIDPEVLKENVKKLIAQKKKGKPITAEADRHVDDRDLFDNEFVPDYEDVNLQEDFSGKEEVRDEVNKNAEDEKLNAEVDTQLLSGDVHTQQEVGRDEDVPLGNSVKKSKKTVSKKYVMHRSRAPSTRATKRSQLVRTPFTQQKKQKSKEGEHKAEPLVVTDKVEEITVYYEDSVAKWDVLKSMYLTDVDRAALKQVNEGIPDVNKFSLRVVDSTGAFVHNYKIPSDVAAKLTAEENKWLAHFCRQKCSQKLDVIETMNSTITRKELLYLIRGGRVDDKVIEALLDRIRSWLHKPENAALDRQYGIVSSYFCHSLYGHEPDFMNLYEVYIRKHITIGRSILIVPMVRHDHWHFLEVRLDENVALHFSSAPHSSYLDPVHKVINYMDHMKAAFDPDKVWRTYQYKAIPCEPQKGTYDCGIYVHLYVRAILQKGDVLHVTPIEDSSEVVRARLAAELIIEGRELKKLSGTLEADDPELKENALLEILKAEEKS